MSWITGRHAVLAAIRRGTHGVLYLSASRDRFNDLVAAAGRARLRIERVTPDWLRRNAGEKARGAALCVTDGASVNETVVDLKEWLQRDRRGTPHPIVALDHITDPHNLGAILRSALLSDVGLVIIPNRRSAVAGDTVSRVSVGASRFVPISYVSNLRAALQACRDAGWWIYGADAGGDALHTVSFDRNAVIVLGAEGPGLSPIVQKTVDAVVTIPSAPPPEADVDSFNVSVATGILLYEYRRQWPLGDRGA
ncbi:MAG: RNA methyltransferase [Spirochaetales bacterium]|nr:RNA methyltransferase [Spirochaetales bacterium]